MKKIILFCFLASVMIACGPPPEEAEKYHQSLIVHQEKASQAYQQLEQTLEDTAWENIEAELEVFHETLHQEIMALKGKPRFDEQEDYKTVILNYLLELKYVGDNEVKHYIEFMHTPDEELTDKDRKYFGRLKPLIKEKYQVAEGHLKNGQNLFAEKYGATIE